MNGRKGSFTSPAESPVNPSVPLELLSEHAHPEGGWGYVSGNAPQLEPTILALLALDLEADKYASLIQKGKTLLERCKRSDGSYRLALGRDEAVWPTAQALYTSAILGDPVDSLRGSAAFLLNLKSRTPAAATSDREVQDINLQLIGWPWGKNNFAWVEPTSWACLSLRLLGLEQHTRVQQGIELLLDRANDTGGINYGNRVVLGKQTAPMLGPSSIFLISLQGHSHPRIKATVQYLLANLDTGDIENLAWAKFALDLYRDEPGVVEGLARIDTFLTEAFERRQKISWLKTNPPRFALTALALNLDKRNYFRLPTTPIQIGQLPAPMADEGPVKLSIGQRVGDWFKGLAVKAVGAMRQPPAQSLVHIIKVSSYDACLVDLLSQQFAYFRDKVPLQGKRVVLKPNMVEYHPNKVINTHPSVVSAAIELCKREGAKEIIVAEGPGHCRNVEHIVTACGLGEVLDKHQVPFVDINHDDPVKLPNLGGLTGMSHLFLAKTIATADVVISMPKLKTHHWAGVTLSLKNLFGTLPGVCYGWPKNELHWRGIENSIIDIALTRTPDLAIIDGIVGMEGDGPLNGTPKEMGVLLMGNDMVATDATGSRLMMLDPTRIKTLVLGYGKKLGRILENEIQQLGEPIAGLAKPFETVPHFSGLKQSA